MEFVTGALGTLLPKLGQLLQDEYNLHKNAKKNIKFLRSELQSIQAALHSVGEVPLEQLSEPVKIWANDVRELSYDMEDIVDNFLVRIQGPDPPRKKGYKKFFKKMRDIFTKFKPRHDIGQDINDIKERVKEVAERRDRYKVDTITSTKTMVDPRIISLYTKADNLIGIDEAREELIIRLTKRDAPFAQKKIVSVVGFGGLGKTTLAKAVYDKIEGQFDCTAFVPVGRNPDLKKVFKDILINLDKQQYMSFNFSTFDERQLINEFHEILDKKRYFIVIDDVWETQCWETIKLALVENNSGSRIIITTRNHEVAREAGQVYELQPLSDENSKKLLFARIFGCDSKSSDHQLEEVSDKILRKCGGIPLAIITMASLLVGKPREEWSEVHRSIGFVNKENRQAENTMKILSFSYYDLPPHLRTCFLYLSVFPEDHFIEKGPLIWMWIAEGFVQEKQGLSSIETGEGYFNELVNKSMIQLVEGWAGPGLVICGCQVHDMVLDLIRSISSEENFVTMLQDKNNEGALSSTKTQGKVRRLALANIKGNVEANMDMQQVRSFISCQCDFHKGVSTFISRLRFLRVLSIDFSFWMEDVWYLPVQKLLHLRYLRLCRDVELPEEIGTLKFLQTLDLHDPLTSVGSLTQLLCLRIRLQACIIPDGIGKLTSLQELQIKYVGQEEETLRQFMKELGGLRELKVLRLVMGHQSPSDQRGILMDMVQSLRNLQRMEHLSLHLPAQNMGVVSVDTATFEVWGFLLPRTMQQLSLRWIRFSRFPSFCVNPSRLPNLSQLYLIVDYFDEQDMRILGGLPQLCDVWLWAHSTKEIVCNTIDAAGDDCCLFPKLRRCILQFKVVDFLAEGDSGGVSFCMMGVDASMLLGSQGMDGKAGVASTLMLPCFQQLEFTVHVQELIKDSDDCGSLVLQYFASLQNVRVDIICRGASAAEVGAAEAALRHAADIHPNRPTLKVRRFGEDEMIFSDAEDEKVQQASTSEKD